MGINDTCNSKSNTDNLRIRHAKEAAERYYRENPDSLIPLFEKELRELGFDFEVSSQTFGFIPKYKKDILPIAVRYYQLAKKHKKTNEQMHFMRFFRIKGFDDIVPMLLEDYYSKEADDLTRWFISDCLYCIRSKKFIREYQKISSNKLFGINRQMIVLLLGKLKDDTSVPILIALLEDEEVRLQAICALGEYKRESFRCYFERFKDDPHPGWRKYARTALKKLDNAIG